MKEIASDVTIVGGGAAGLWTAKELIDRGLSVDVVERGSHLATGATTRNEGWLHAGTYHAVAIYDEADAMNVTARTVYGHDATVQFAPESVEHGPTFAFIKEDTLVQNALQRWSQFGIPHREVAVAPFAEQGFDTSAIAAAFEVKDKSVDSRAICKKLASYITERGARIFTRADFRSIDETSADMIINGETHRLKSDQFVITAGTGAKRLFEDMTGEPFPMRYFKSHLAVTKRLTEDNFFYLDPLEAGIMSHGNASIVGINREAVEVQTPDYKVIPEKGDMVLDALARMLPVAGRLTPEQVLRVACVKADVADSFQRQNTDPTIQLQDLNIKVFEPVPGYICAIPGKMTEAPALANAAADYVFGKELRNPVASIQRAASEHPAPHEINPRPADEWLQGQSGHDAA